MLLCGRVGRTRVNHAGTPETQAIHRHPKEEMPNIFVTLYFYLASRAGKDTSYQQTQTSLYILLASFMAASSTTKKNRAFLRNISRMRRKLVITPSTTGWYWLPSGAKRSRGGSRVRSAAARSRQRFPPPTNHTGFTEPIIYCPRQLVEKAMDVLQMLSYRLHKLQSLLRGPSVAMHGSCCFRTQMVLPAHLRYFFYQLKRKTCQTQIPPGIP